MKRGFGLGLVTGILLTVFVGWVPIAGPLVSGFISGLHTRDRREGAIAGFVSGAVGSIILSWVLFIALVEIFITDGGLFGGLSGSVFGAMYALGPLPFMAEVIALATLGGALGAVMRQRWSN